MKAIIFANRSAFDGAMVGKLTSYMAKVGNRRDDITTKLAEGITNDVDAKILLPLNNRYIKDLDWNPQQIVDVDKDDPKWFPNEEI